MAANTPTSCEKQNESLKNDMPLESNASEDVMKTNTFNLQPVSPYAFGEGLPYAPEGWPNPGDIWGWRVGNRTNKAGYYIDRSLHLPRSPENPSWKRLRLQSKPEVERYIRTNFPNMEIGAFFASFCWKVPSTKLSPTEDVQTLSVPAPVKLRETGKDVTKDIAIAKDLKRKAQVCSLPIRKSCRLVHARRHLTAADQNANNIVDLCALNEEANIESIKDLKGTSDAELGQPLSNTISQPKNSFLAACNLVDCKEESPNVTIAENFDDYLSTLEDILVLPRAETSLSDSVVPAINLETELAERRAKLSSLLAVDFSSLASSENLAEVANLASQLQKDPNLNIDQLIKLKLVEEIPLVSEAFKEAKGNIEEADKFFADLEAKKLKVPSMKKEYSELKDKVAQVQVEIEKSSSAIQDIDDQILQLQLKRSEMSSALEAMHKKKLELSSTQAMLANSIPAIVGEIQNANSEKPKWDLKKANCAKRVAEIQERFITLRGLTF